VEEGWGGAMVGGGALHLDGKESPTRKKTVIRLGYRDLDPLMFTRLRGGML
jgi:hypothetical protein